MTIILNCVYFFVNLFADKKFFISLTLFGMTAVRLSQFRCLKIDCKIIFCVAAGRETFEPVARKPAWAINCRRRYEQSPNNVISTEGRNINYFPHSTVSQSRKRTFISLTPLYCNPGKDLLFPSLCSACLPHRQGWQSFVLLNPLPECICYCQTLWGSGSRNLLKLVSLCIWYQRINSTHSGFFEFTNAAFLSCE